MAIIQVGGQKSVAIVGAGLTGLLAAHGLQQRGFRVVVLEQDASIEARPRDWSILIHWAMPIFEKLVPPDILADLCKAFCNPDLEFDDKVESLPCYNGVTGHLLFQSKTPGARRMSRQKLRRLLSRRVDIKWNKTAVNLAPTREGVRVCFEDGDMFEANYLLGADGSSSKIRELLLGADAACPQPSGFLFASGITEFADARKTRSIVKAHPVAALMMGTGSVGAVGVMSVNDSGDESNWTTFWTKVWRGEGINLKGPEALEYIRQNTEPLRDVFQWAVDWTPADSTVHINEMKYWSPIAWENLGGRVTLAGDAAHPMLIFRGQGFQHSIVDADNFVKMLAKLESSEGLTAGREEAFAAYDAELVERGSTAVQQSLDEAEKSLDADKIKHMLMVTNGHGRST